MKILLAEDDDHTREGLATILSAEGYEVVAARDGDEALRLFAAEAPDFALLDVMMPGTDGYALCRELLRRQPGLPVIFVSARGEEVDRVVGLELGADDYIRKPFGVREVIARIRAVTRRTLSARRAAAPAGAGGDGGDGGDGGRPGDGDRDAPFRMGDLLVQPAELRARRGDEVIDLSLREVRILQLLHREQGRVVRRDTFFSECWGLRYLPNSRTLDQHVSKLRRRIEPDPRNPTLIRTVHGVGYRYDP